MTNSVKAAIFALAYLVLVGYFVYAMIGSSNLSFFSSLLIFLIVMFPTGFVFMYLDQYSSIGSYIGPLMVICLFMNSIFWYFIVLYLLNSQKGKKKKQKKTKRQFQSPFFD